MFTRRQGAIVPRPKSLTRSLLKMISDYETQPDPSEITEPPIDPSAYPSLSEDEATRATSASSSIGTLVLMSGREAAKTIGRAYHKANPNAATRSATSSGFEWAGVAFDVMGLAGGALGLGASPNESWILTSISMRNDARIVIVPQLINAKFDSNKPGRVSQSPGILLPGDETVCKFYKDSDETRHYTLFRFAVASLNPAITNCLMVDLLVYQYHEGGGDDIKETCSHFLRTVAIRDQNGNNLIERTAKSGNNVRQDPPWPVLPNYYYQFTGANNLWPSFGVSALSTNVWYGQTGNNSLRIVFTPHPDGY
ncbi:hypothetical protein V0288_14580 [Pannus brasiliensis CCIBt3594]|uniref:Uncharacterized protein n=1 Tax=Pannus brasiliensis CCIBt3594 TaxID=1427578 RepID=A0AAW9QXM2_9CHRO